MSFETYSGPKRGCPLHVENSTESHKPVEIGYLRAQGASRSGETKEGSDPARRGRDGPLRGRERLFHEA